VANVLMVTSSVGMLNGVTGHTTNHGPAVGLSSVFVVGSASLQHGLLNSATTGDQANHSSALGVQSLLLAGGELDSALALVVVGDDDGVFTSSLGELASVTGLVLDVADDATLGHLADGQDVANGESGLLSAVHELARVHALGGDEQLGLTLVVVRVSELDLGDGGSSAGIVDDLSDDTTEVSSSLSEIQTAELDGSNSLGSVGCVDGASSTSATSDNLSHVKTSPQ